MNNELMEAGWTDEHLSRLLGVVNEEVQRARVAAQFLPTIGPIDRSAVGFSDYTLTPDINPLAPPPFRIGTNDLPNHLLTTVAVPVHLTSSEIADGDLDGATVRFRRAANILARLEDAIIFNDRIVPGNPIGGIAGIPQVFTVTGGGPPPGTAVELGLLPLDTGFGPVTPFGPRLTQPIAAAFPPVPGPPEGIAVTNAIIQAMSLLENAGQSGPFACALSPYLYEAVYSPAGNFVAAKDRLLPILNGPIVRSSAILDRDIFGNVTPYGLVIALGGSPVGIRVTTEVGIRFVQITPEPRYLFRVSERFGLRITDPQAIAVLY